MPMPVTPSPWQGIPFASPEMLLAQQQAGEVPLEEMDYSGFAAPAPEMPAKAPTSSGLTKSDYDTLAALYAESGKENKRVQAEGIKRLEDQRGMIDAIPRQMDLSPFANLIGQWTGQDLTKGYKKPVSPEERMQMLMNLEGGIQKSREGMASNELELLKSRLGIASQREMAKDREETRKLTASALKTQKDMVAGDRHDRQTQQSREKFVGTEDAKQMAGITKFQQALDVYEDLVSKHGVSPTGKAAADLDSAYSKMSTAYKEAEKLGALAGPDLGLLHEAVGKSGDIKSYFTSQYRGGKEGILSSIKNIKEGGKRDFDDAYSRASVVFPNIKEDVLPEYRRQYENRPTKNLAAKRSNVQTAENSATKTVNGVSYRKVPGGWEKVP